MTANDLIARTMRLLGIIDATETPQPEDLRDVLSSLNDLIDAFATQRAMVYHIARTQYPLTVGIASYTIGIGVVGLSPSDPAPVAAFAQARPVWIDRVSIIPDRAAVPLLEISLGAPLTIQAYQGLTVKASTSTYPNRIYYDFGWTNGLGTITVYPVPTTSATDLVLYCPSTFVAFANLTANYSFPPGVARMLRYNLAVEIAPDFNAVASEIVMQRAAITLADFKRANHRLTDANFDPALVGVSRGYDIYSDT